MVKDSSHTFGMTDFDFTIIDRPLLPHQNPVEFAPEIPMLVLSCSLWATLKFLAPFLNLIPAVALLLYLKDDTALRKRVFPIVGLILYVGTGCIMFYSIKAAQAAEIVVVDPSCSHR